MLVEDRKSPAAPSFTNISSYWGLSKLEYAAVHISAALYASPLGLDCNRVADMSVKMANALFDRLEIKDAD